jgi:hypothetical protein
MTVVCYLTTLSESILHSVGDKMIQEYGAVDGIRIGKRNPSARGKLTPMPLSEPQIPHGLTWGSGQGCRSGKQKTPERV